MPLGLFLCLSEATTHSYPLRIFIPVWPMEPFGFITSEMLDPSSLIFSESMLLESKCPYGQEFEPVLITAECQS